MNPFRDSEVWAELSTDKRRRITAAIAASEQQWLYFLIPDTVTDEQIAAFGRRNLLRGFFEQPSRVITAISARRVANGIELRIGASPHPTGISLPCWGCDMRAALEGTFKQVARIPSDVTTQ